MLYNWLIVFLLIFNIVVSASVDTTTPLSDVNKALRGMPLKVYIEENGKRREHLIDVSEDSAQTHVSNINVQFRLAWERLKSDQVTMDDLKSALSIVKFMHTNLLYHEHFFKLVDKLMTLNCGLDDPSRGRHSLNVYNYISTFHYMVYLGYIPSLEYQLCLKACLKELREEFKTCSEKDLQLKKFQQHNATHQKVIRHYTCLELTCLLATTYAMIPVIYLEKIDSEVRNDALHTAKTILSSDKVRSINAQRFDVLDGHIKQYMYWVLLLEKDSKLNEKAMNALLNFFSGKSRFASDENSCSSGAEFRFRDKLLELNATKGLNFALDVNPEDIKSNIDVVIWDARNIMFFEVDGPFHFVRNLLKPLAAPIMNGQTFLKTLVLMQFGKVLRISTKCDERTFEARVRKFPAYIKEFLGSREQMMLIDPENYSALVSDTFPKVKSMFEDDGVRKDAEKAKQENIDRVQKRKLRH